MADFIAAFQAKGLKPLVHIYPVQESQGREQRIKEMLTVLLEKVGYKQ